MMNLSLAKYNFRVLTTNNWWQLVFPLAASQLTVFWNLITQRYAPALPATTVEMVSPLLAAFLGAHLLSTEYRVGIGAILASKPIHIGKVVVARLLVILALVWTLAILSLIAYYYGMEPYDIALPALACIPSILFLSLFALTFATLFRNPLAGFGIATLYWALGLPSGPPINHYMSLRSLSSFYQASQIEVGQALVEQWWIAKIILLAGALALYMIHARLLFTLGTTPTVRTRRRALGWVAGVLVFYLVSGGVVKVVYGYTHRGHIYPDDASWFRRQFSSFGPLPVASLFGSTFANYLGDIPNTWRIQQDGESDLLGDTVKHRRDLDAIVNSGSKSIWAPSVAELRAHLEATREENPDKKAAYYRVIIDRYPDSPYFAYALREAARAYSDAADNERTKAEQDYRGSDEHLRLQALYQKQARAGYEDLLARAGKSPYRSDGFRFLAVYDRQHGNLESAANYAQQWYDSAPVQERSVATSLLAMIRHDQGRNEEARQAAERTFKDAATFYQAVRDGLKGKTPGTLTTWQSAVSTAEEQAKALIKTLSAPAPPGKGQNTNMHNR